MNKLKQAKKLMLEYKQLLIKLRSLGVGRSNKILTDYGEYYVCDKLGLKLNEKSTEHGFDAKKNGKKYEIKTRWNNTNSKPTTFHFSDTQKKISDYVIILQLDENFEEEFMLQIPKNKIITNRSGSSSIFQYMDDYEI